jgi:hypothetical protein
MSRTYKKNDKYRPKEERLRVRAVRREPADVQRLGRALIALAMADNEARAQQQDQRKKGGPPRSSK